MTGRHRRQQEGPHTPEAYVGALLGVLLGIWVGSSDQMIQTILDAVASALAS